MDERMIPVPGGRLYAADEGVGPPIVLLHAGIVDLRAWDSLVPQLVELGYRTVRYDARGFGRSETADVEYSNRADLVAVMDTFGMSQACLVGNSRGGHIALDAAVEFSDRVAAVVTLGSDVGGYEAPSTPEELAFFEEMERLEKAADADATADLHVRIWVDGPGQPPDRVPAAIREAVRAMDREVGDPTRVRGRPIPLDPPADLRLADLRVPILAIAGGLDVSDLWAAAQHLEQSCPSARAILLPDVAHMIAMEAPARVAELIDGFLRPLLPFG